MQGLNSLTTSFLAFYISFTPSVCIVSVRGPNIRVKQV
jgi:hypothetical protein